MMLRGIIFDFDGVMIDSHPAHKQAWRLFFASVGREVSDEELDFVLEGHKRAEILRHFLGSLTDEQVKDYGARKEAFFRTVAPEPKINHGLPEFLEQVGAQGLTMALASSASRERIESILRQLNLTHPFRAVVTGDDVVRGKPDPAIFKLAAERMQVRPDEILVCEDAVNGVEAAKAAGMKCLAIAANGRSPLLAKAGADKVVPGFTHVRLADLHQLFMGSI
jgi:beta-phosphoglucomutase